MHFPDGLSSEVCNLADLVDFFDNLLGVGKMNTEQKKKLASLRNTLLRADMESTREKYETDPHFRAVVDRGVQAIFKKCEGRKTPIETS